MSWNYKRTETEYEELPAGRYRVAIENAEMCVSKAGNEMLKLTLAVSGTKKKLWHYIVFMLDKPEVTNGKLTNMFDAFGIEEGNFNIASYKGKVGGADVKHDDQGRARVSYFLKPEQTAKLPPWKGEQIAPADFTPVDVDFDGDLF